MQPRNRFARVIILLLAGVAVAGGVLIVVSPVSSTEQPPDPTIESRWAQAPGDWVLSTDRIDRQDSYHAFVGNGYLGQRVPPAGTGYAAPGGKTGWPLYTPRYDGSFVAGLYGHNTQVAADRHVMAAIPTWTTLNVSTGDARAETYSSSTAHTQISRYRQSVDLRHAVVRTSLTWTASDRRTTDLVYEVIADRNSPHAGVVRLRMTPHWSGDATVTDIIDGRGARRISTTGGGQVSGGHRAAADRHVVDSTMQVSFRTDGTKIDGTVASTLRSGPGVRARQDRPAAAPKGLTTRQAVTFGVQRDQVYEFTKYVGVDTALTSAAPRHDAITASLRAAERGWRRIAAAHRASWEKLWRSDIELTGQPELQRWVRSAQYGLLSSVRVGSSDGLAPTGLTSDNYAGLVFWDAEIWMYPSLLATRPDLAKSVVEYRFRTREGASANARRLGYRGLFYPWNGAAKGDLWSECHSWNPPPHCLTQIHLQSDIALAVWQYYLATGDKAWLRGRGWPMLKGIAEFWAARAVRNADGSYSIKNVAGPDEYSNGVDDAVFTNAGAATALRHATRAAAIVGGSAPASWNAIAGALRIPYDEEQKVFRQYDGYGGSLIKQADTVLLMYPLEWPMTKAAATNTLDYYAARTDPDGPAMTDSVHAVDAAAIGAPGCVTQTYLRRSIEPFVRGPFAQFSEARGDKAGAEDPLAGSPAQDFLTGKGGFLQVFTHGLTGMRMREHTVRLDPMLPPMLADGVRLRGLHWQGRTFDIAIGADQTTVRLTSGAPFVVETPQGEQVVSKAAPALLKTRRPDLAPTDNLARCRAASASSAEPGMIADAALDGNTATAWIPAKPDGSLTADLGQVQRIARITVAWTRTRPASHRVEISMDGRRWKAADDLQAPGGQARARYVRVTVRAADVGRLPGIAELAVTG
jgi:trehalose/maltose hydrolase-like predicted phosphorylase